MKNYYVLAGPAGENNHAKLTKVGPDIWLLLKVWVWPHLRQQGIGHRLLQQVCAAADGEGVILALEVSGFGGGIRLDDRQLLSWYARHGFVRGDGYRMRRNPNPLYMFKPGSQATPPSSFA